MAETNDTKEHGHQLQNINHPSKSQGLTVITLAQPSYYHDELSLTKPLE
jgi:hypothetical protein